MKKKNSNRELRIVSLAPSATSILCAIGARKSLVGVTKWCADVAPVSHLPKLGDCWHMDSVDRILALRPTLVIGCVPYKQETVAKLLEHPLTFLAMNPRTLLDVEEDIRLLGRIVNREAAAERVIRKMRTEFAAIKEKAKEKVDSSGKIGHRNDKLKATRQTDDGRVRVYCEAWPNPRISSPPWVAELVEIAGGVMTTPAGQKVSDEQVAETQPEVIVLAWAATGAKADSKKTYAVPAWRNVPATQNRRVVVIRDELLNTPGPPLVEGVRELYKALHPEDSPQRHRDHREKRKEK